MKRLLTVLAMALMLLVFVWGQAVPAFADEGEDHPWEGEGNNSGTGQYRHSRADFYTSAFAGMDLLFNTQMLLVEDLSSLAKKTSGTTDKFSSQKERDTYTDRIKQASIE